MATEAQLIEALRRADAAGNVDDAQAIANLIKQQRSNADPDRQHSPATLQRSSDGSPQDPPKAPPGDPTLGNFGTGLRMGLNDLWNGTVQHIAHALPDSVQDAIDVEALDKILADQETARSSGRQAAGKDGPDLPRLIGNIVNPTNFLFPGGGAKTALGAATRAATQGGVLSGAMPVTKDHASADDFWNETAQNAGAGALAGGVLGGTIHSGSRLVDDGAKFLASKGVTMTPGQILGGLVKTMEDKATSLPILGHFISKAQGRAGEDFFRAAVDESLAPIGKTLPKDLSGRDALAYANDQISQAYSKIVPKLRSQFDTQLESAIADAELWVPSAHASEFSKRIDALVRSKLDDNAALSGASLNRARSELGRLATNYKASADPSQRDLGNAFATVKDALDASIDRSNPESLVAAFRNVTRAEALSQRVDRASTHLAAEDGQFSPKQLMNAVRAKDKSYGKKAFTEGRAMMQDFAEAGQGVLSSRVRDSGTAGRLLPLAAGAAYATNPALIAGELVGSAVYTTPMLQAIQAGLLAVPKASNAVKPALPASGVLAHWIRDQSNQKDAR